MLSARAAWCSILDELVAWIKGMDAYRNGRGGDRQLYLSLWSRRPDQDQPQGQRPDHRPPSVLQRHRRHPAGPAGELADATGRADGFVDRLLIATRTRSRTAGATAASAPRSAGKVDASSSGSCTRWIDLLS